MKKPQPRTAQSSKVEPRKANRGDEQQSAAGRTIEAVDVAAIPIEDPFHEKSLAEIDPNKLLFYLCRGKGFGGNLSPRLAQSNHRSLSAVLRTISGETGRSSEGLCCFISAFGVRSKVATNVSRAARLYPRIRTERPEEPIFPRDSQRFSCRSRSCAPFLPLSARRSTADSPIFPS